MKNVHVRNDDSHLIRAWPEVRNKLPGASDVKSLLQLALFSHRLTHTQVFIMGPFFQYE